MGIGFMELKIENINTFSGKRLYQIFEQAYIDKVEGVDVSYNDLTELSDDLIFNILTLNKWLRRLDLGNNHLTTLPGYITDLYNLEYKAFGRKEAECF